VHPSPIEVLFLCTASLLAGTVDAIAGGGGLITMPALLSIPSLAADTHLALGTNKGQAVFGSSAALARFSQAGLVDRPRALPAFLLGFMGSLLGARLAIAIPPARLKPIVVSTLAIVAVYLTFRRRGGAAHVARKPHPMAAALSALFIGAYDGFIGPGTGTFLIIAFVGLLGDSMARASANAKVVNFASNLAALALFSWSGFVVWTYALPMALAQLTGGIIGAHLAVRVGDGLVRKAVLLVSLSLIVKVLIDLRGAS
jgi:uncharacterized membrane protein YfcA